MKRDKKIEFFVYIIFFLSIYLCGGLFFYFFHGYDVKSTIKILATGTLLMVIVAILVVAVAWLLLFVSSKIKR